jgi:hypothetical protein
MAKNSDSFPQRTKNVFERRKNGDDKLRKSDDRNDRTDRLSSFVITMAMTKMVL